ncbi:MAG: hypothetical protein M0T86_07800 [Betaproteobacteria bacterium]|nr:hypothetical protein [Betaproteobacteria bacterium]
MHRSTLPASSTFPVGWGEIAPSLYRIPWHRGPGSDLRHPVRDHHDFSHNAIRGELITVNLRRPDVLPPAGARLRKAQERRSPELAGQGVRVAQTR